MGVIGSDGASPLMENEESLFLLQEKLQLTTKKTDSRGISRYEYWKSPRTFFQVSHRQSNAGMGRDLTIGNRRG